MNNKNKLSLKIYHIVFAMLFLSQFLTQVIAQEEEDMKVVPAWPHFSDLQNSIFHHLTGQAFELLNKREADVESIVTLNDWQLRQEELRRTLADIIGPFPEKNSLNARIQRTIRKDDFRVEHIIFESRPGFYVTSSLYIPGDLKKRQKAPAIVFCSGHSTVGYRSKGYQYAIINFVKKGFIVFAFDPLGQGERLQYFDPEISRSTIGGPTMEHSYSGAQVFIAGSSLANYMIWDGIRAVDYLLTREEVDPARIGITGRSGGGTQSAYIAAMDTRIYASAPECYITNFTRLLQSKGPQDSEQNLFNGIYRGIDHADFLAVRAPNPCLLVTTTNDIFNLHGARETADEVRHIYKAYGKPENFEMTEDIAFHESTKKNREVTYAFFQKHLNNPGNPFDEEIDMLSYEELLVTTTGQISTFTKCETVFSLNAREAERLMMKLKKSRNDNINHIPGILESAKQLSGYLRPGEQSEPVFTGNIQKEGYFIEKYFIEGEMNYIIPYLLFVPEKQNKKALIYIHPSGKLTDSISETEIEWFVNKGFVVLVPDLLGTGETGPGDALLDAHFGNALFRMWHASILINKSITGIRAEDVVKLTHLLRAYQETEEIYALAKGSMSPVILHAAAFEPSIKKVALIEPYSSYHSIVNNRFYSREFIHNTVAGAVHFYDLPDLAASLAPKKLLMLNVMDGAGEQYNKESLENELSFIRRVYREKKSEDSLKIAVTSPDKPVNIFLQEWINSP